ncbi:hypothetical protein H632_c233p3 [Helicosporidium sp. ATCC 50920]|nr:hypothetical protein H632_c233p3 [Helicosporidium sp. ATCC 50920]|eukprot:KDD76417.1 hypothetical protein H632_c233p3 [Helicosporidium sp. ATCC 50920]
MRTSARPVLTRAFGSTWGSKEKATVDKTTMIADIAASQGMTKVQVKHVVDQFLHDIVRHSVEGRRVSLRNLGTFEKRARASRKTRHVLSGEYIEVPAHDGVGFSAAPAFKAAMREGVVASNTVAE